LNFSFSLSSSLCGFNCQISSEMVWKEIFNISKFGMNFKERPPSVKEKKEKFKSRRNRKKPCKKKFFVFPYWHSKPRFSKDRIFLKLNEKGSEVAKISSIFRISEDISNKISYRGRIWLLSLIFVFKKSFRAFSLKRFFWAREDLKQKSPNWEIFAWKTLGALIGRAFFFRFL